MQSTESERWLRDLIAPNPEVRHKAKMAIGGLTPDDKVDVQAFISNLSSENQDISLWCAVALDRLEGRAIDAVPILIPTVVSHPAFGVRQAAVRALSRIAPGLASSRQAIFLAFSDMHSFVRREALSASIKIPDLSDDELKKIEAMANDPDEEVASWSEVALRNIRSRKGYGPASV